MSGNCIDARGARRNHPSSSSGGPRIFMLAVTARGTFMSISRPASRRILRTAGPLAAAAAILLSLGAAGVSAARHEEARSLLDIREVVHARGGKDAGHTARPTSSPNLTNHGGPILASSRVTSIFWGKSWTATDAKVTGLDTLYSGIGGSSYMNTNTEYSSSNGRVGSAVAFDGHL